MFFGKRDLSLTEKNQLTLPTNYCEGMNSVFVTQGFDRNLILLSQKGFNKISSQVAATSISDPLARLLSRLFLGSAVEMTIDKSGRIDLPLNLCEYAGLDKDVTIVGQGDYFEIWSPALWKKQMDNLNELDANANRFEKFNVSLS